jgi:hypothetical protein
LHSALFKQIKAEVRKGDAKGMKSIKLGAIFLTSVMALAVVGVGYAWWQEDLLITGIVTTGSFGMGWSLREDWIYPVDGEPFLAYGYNISHDWKNIITVNETTGEAVWLSDQDSQGFFKTMNIELHNVYPCTDLIIFGDLHYWGIVPGHIVDISDVADINYSGSDVWDEDVDWDQLKWLFMLIEITDTNHPDITPGIYPYIDLEEELVSTQWHQNHFINFTWYIHFIEWDMVFQDYWGTWWNCSAPLQTGTGTYDEPYGLGLEEGDDVPMDAEMRFTIDIHVVQYNMPGSD